MYGWLNGGMNEWIRIVWLDEISAKVVVKLRQKLKLKLSPEVKVNRQTHLFSTHDTTRHGTKRYIRTISSWIQFVFVSLLLNCATNNLSLSLFFARSLANDLRLFFLLLLTSVGDTVGSDAASA